MSRAPLRHSLGWMLHGVAFAHAPGCEPAQMPVFADDATDVMAAVWDATADEPQPAMDVGDASLIDGDTDAGAEAADPSDSDAPEDIQLLKGWDADVPSCLPSSMAVPMPTAVTQAEACVAGASQDEFKDFFPDYWYPQIGREFQHLTSGLVAVAGEAGVAILSENGGKFGMYPFTLPVSTVLVAEQFVVTSASGHVAIVSMKGYYSAVISWLDPGAMTLAASAIKSLVFGIQGSALAADGTLFIASGFHGPPYIVAAYAQTGKLKWAHAVPQQVNHLDAVPGGGVLASVLAEDWLADALYPATVHPGHAVLFDANGQLVARVPLPPGGRSAMLDGHGGMYAEIRQGQMQQDAGCRTIIRTDACGKVLWADPVATVRNGDGLGLTQGGTSAGGIRRVPGGVGVVTEVEAPKGFVGRWTAQGRRLPDVVYKTALPASVYRLSAGPMADGGLGFATNAGFFRMNAAGSFTCKGCGPPSPDCDDQDPCTVDTCSVSLADCTHAAIPGCKKAQGTCTADADCDDGELCTADACQKPTGACSHVAQKTCLTGNSCVYDTGTCVQGKCTPVLSTASPTYPSSKLLPPATGWAAKLDSVRPQVHEASGGDLIIAGGWAASRMQGNGVVRWHRPQSGRISASARAAADGMLLAVVQPLETAQAGMTRLVRLSAQGQPVADGLVKSGLADEAMTDPWQERTRWLVARPGGGHVLVGTTSWTADAWQGRLVTLSAQGALTAAVDVTLPGFATGTVPHDRGIDQVYPLDDGGVVVGWHRKAKPAGREWGAARLLADGQVAWSKLLVDTPMDVAGFDPWRPRAMVRKSLNWASSQTSRVSLVESGPKVLTANSTTDVAFLRGFATFTPNFDDLAYSELPDERTAASHYSIASIGNTSTSLDNQQWSSWPPNDGFSDVPMYVLGAYLSIFGHVASDLYVLSDKRVAVIATYPPGWYLSPTLVVLGHDGRFKPCGIHPEQIKCKTWPAQACPPPWP